MNLRRAAGLDNRLDNLPHNTKRTLLIPGLTQDGFNRSEAFFHQVEWPPVEYKVHLPVVQADLPQDGRLQIGAIVRTLHSPVAYFICSAFCYSALHAAA